MAKITGKSSRAKTRKKQKKVKKQQKIRPEELKFQETLKVLQRLVPFSTPSLPHLAKAITVGAKVFLTSDPLLSEQGTVLEKQFGIFIVDDYFEAQEIIAKGKRPSSLELQEEGNEQLTTNQSEPEQSEPGTDLHE